MSFIVLKPWALHPAQILCFFFSPSHQLLCISLLIHCRSGLTFVRCWELPYTPTPTLPGMELGVLNQDPASGSIFLFCLLVV